MQKEKRRVKVKASGSTAGIGINLAAKYRQSISFEDGREIPENGLVSTETAGLSSHVFNGDFKMTSVSLHSYTGGISWDVNTQLGSAKSISTIKLQGDASSGYGFDVGFSSVVDGTSGVYWTGFK